MNQFPPKSTEEIDTEHLKLLAIFSNIFAGISGLGCLGLILHCAVMMSVVLSDISADDSEGQMMVLFFIAFYFVGFVFLIAGLVGNILSAKFMRERINRKFSLIVAGINCCWAPFGTALGVFTFIVLMRESVRLSYQSSEPARA